ncbi:MAG TPA: peptidoglycan DD-metalloendopeptidase family protein [Duganella sp.]|nr:peptidoglycan DD-metalloendopeptidase family protein [Duganella sp.]
MSQLRHKLWLAASLLALAGTAHGAPAAPKESLQELQQRIEALKQEIDRTEGAHAEASDALKASEQAISEANRKLYDLTQQQKNNASALDSIRKNRSGLESTIVAQQKLLASQLYQQYLNGEQSYLRALLQQRDPNTIARDLQYFSYVAKARAKLITDLRKNLGQVSALDAKTESTLKEVAHLKEAQVQEKQELQKQQAERRAMLKKLTAQLQAQRGEISRLQRDEKRLSQLVERLAKIVPKAPPRKAEAKKSAPAKTQRNEALPAPDTDGGAFAALKGKLRLPVRGELANRFGAAREDSGISWKGLFIRAGEGDEVRAIAGGRVVFADWLRGFGNLMIVDHGDGYMSLYGNNQALLKRVGDEVKTGDHIAAVGNSGGNPESGLYFELRRQSKPFDPLTWCVVH